MSRLLLVYELVTFFSSKWLWKLFCATGFSVAKMWVWALLAFQDDPSCPLYYPCQRGYCLFFQCPPVQERECWQVNLTQTIAKFLLKINETVAFALLCVREVDSLIGSYSHSEIIVDMISFFLWSGLAQRQRTHFPSRKYPILYLIENRPIHRRIMEYIGTIHIYTPLNVICLLLTLRRSHHRTL
jgi:hypothetical protein